MSEDQIEVTNIYISKPNPTRIDYFGDGVYCETLPAGAGIVLKANNHLDPTDTIHLEVAVLKELFQHCKDVGIFE